MATIGADLLEPVILTVCQSTGASDDDVKVANNQLGAIEVALPLCDRIHYPGQLLEGVARLEKDVLNTETERIDGEKRWEVCWIKQPARRECYLHGSYGCRTGIAFDGHDF